MQGARARVKRGSSGIGARANAPAAMLPQAKVSDHTPTS